MNTNEQIIEKLDSIIALLSKPRILTQDPFDRLQELNEKLVIEKLLPKTYAEAVDAGELIRPRVVKLELPPYPPIPSGYSHWEDRGCGWVSEEFKKFAIYGGVSRPNEWRVSSGGTCASGNTNVHYIEAIPLPSPEFRYFRSERNGREWKVSPDGVVQTRRHYSDRWLDSGSRLIDLENDSSIYETEI